MGLPKQTDGKSKLVTSNDKCLNFKISPEDFEELVIQSQKRNSSPTSVAKEEVMAFCKKLRAKRVS